MERTAGILMPISSLPGKYGIGCFNLKAYEFVDFLRDAGQTYWQILPIHPTSYGDSPYQSFSTFAGNPYFIDLEALIAEGVLSNDECDSVFFGDEEDDINYAALYEGRKILLTMAYERSRISENPEYQKFTADNGWWLEDYALFMALKDFFNGQCWYEWPEDIRLRYDYALDHYRRELYFDIEYQKYLQFKFFQQYGWLKNYANSQGVKIIGDIPIYVAMDSADTWANPRLFQLDARNMPTAVAGCPPDGFSATGQLWGNPLYRWDYHRETGFDWWLTRLWYVYQLYDVTRIDHFRGFDEYYSIPYGHKTAEFGHWEKGPGIELFRRAEKFLGWHEVIAEDLGFVTDSVRQLVRDSGFPGMKVLQFAFDSRDTGSARDYLPHNYTENAVVYTGTHDNDTTIGWFEAISDDDWNLARDYLCDFYTPDEEMDRPFVALAMQSIARMCIIPMQDYLGLGTEARMNTPSTIGCNWRWRMTEDQFTEDLCRDILAQTRRYGRTET
ncbi:MAG: 4-alpha-glucanotransferase [Oscillospiraceae bacterium]|nr:4-alpha-glucanotransferase [Oscillospiraceae bacterium]